MEGVYYCYSCEKKREFLGDGGCRAYRHRSLTCLDCLAKRCRDEVTYAAEEKI
jgi:hypothetical protein